METPKSILTISRDRALQHTRTLMLVRAGYFVSPAHSDQEALKLLDVCEDYSLVLICHSVPEPSRIGLAKEIKAKCPTVPILMLYYDDIGSTKAQVDGSLHIQDNPEAMLTTIEFLMKSGSSRAA
jgi:DNA-binding response OmpR family regulator